MTNSSSNINSSLLKIVSLNAKGLNTPEKRSKLLLTMYRSKADIIFLQETHFRSNATPKLQNYRYPTAYHATNPLHKSKGVSILIARSCPFQITDSLIDVEGRYLILKGSLLNRKFTLANIYAPNLRQVPFFKKITNTLTTFQEGTLILGGDFNVPLNPIQDTSTGSSSFPYAALKAIKSSFKRLLLHDTWRTLNPNDKDYTFYSAPHDRYSRIDYIFMTQQDLSLLHQASIDPMLISDHHPISLTLKLPTTTSRSHTWKLDPSLLNDPSIAAEVESSLKHFFQENNSIDTSPLTNWEAHKCVIRGVLLAAAAKRNRERKKRYSELLNKIHRLEGTHKHTQALSTMEELIQTRKELLDMLDTQIRRNYILSKKTFYEYGNKASKLLARALQATKASTTIHSITDPSGCKLTKIPDIARQFVQYYSKLYNLHPPDHPANENARKEMIADFLKQYGPTPISDSTAQTLASPLTREEIDIALKQLKSGKSPGPDGLTVGYYKTYADILTPFS